MSLEISVTLPRNRFDLDLSCTLEQQTTGIFGPSGAGKTSLFNLIAGIEKPERGQIVLNGRELVNSETGTHVPMHKRGIGVVFQENLLFPHLTIRENLLFGLRYRSTKKKALFDDVVGIMHLGDHLEEFPHRLSGGEQQRTAIGRALLASPELLLMDEPFNALDSGLRLSILPYLKTLQQELQIPMLVISHDIGDILRLTRSILFISRGRAVGPDEISMSWERQLGEFTVSGEVCHFHTKPELRVIV